MAGPLTGYRVIESTLAGAGPFAGACLAALGADVIKLERPKGDTSLEVVPRLRGLSHLYLAANSGVRSIVVDLHNDEDRALVRRLIRSADVFLQNLRVGATDRLGLGPADLAQLKPDLVACSITGYGEHGPLARDACNDPTAQAFSGFASLNGRPGDPPELFRTYAHLDVTTASYAVFGTLAALVRRQRTGKGAHVQVSLLGSALANAGSRVATYRLTGALPELLGSAAAESAPHRAFVGNDGVWFTVGITRPETWPALCQAVGLPEIGNDPRFATNECRVVNRAALEARLEERFASKPAEEWIARLREADVPAGPVYSDDFDAIRADPQVVANRMMDVVEHVRRGSYWLGAPPWRFSRTPAGLRAAPEPGLDGDAIRRLPDGDDLPPKLVPPPLPVLDPGAPPLAGVKVIEIAGGIAGPYAAKLLGDAGATILKIEGPAGDPARDFAPRHGDRSVPFLYLNEEKTLHRLAPGETLDVETFAGSAIVIADHDERWLDPALIDRAIARNPRLVVCGIDGYGTKGPLADLPAAELVIQGMAGYLGSLGTKGEAPIRLGADVAGFNTGLAAATAALAAWLGGGQTATVSALATLIHLRSITWASWSDPDQQIGFAYDNVWRSRDFGYTARDRRIYIATGRGTDHLWAQFLIAIGLDDYLIHPVVGAGGHLVLGTAPYAEQWRDLFDAAFSKRSADELTELLRSIGGKPSAVYRLDEVLAHEQTAAGAAIDATGLPHPVAIRDLSSTQPLL